MTEDRKINREQEQRMTVAWNASGQELSEFWQQLSSLDESTVAIVLDSNALAFAGILDTTQDFEEMGYTCPLVPGYKDSFATHVVNTRAGDTVVVDTSLSPITSFLSERGMSAIMYRSGERPTLRKLNKEKLEERFGEALTEELLRESKMLIYQELPHISEAMIVSPLAIGTLLRRARLAGDAMTDPSLGRTMEIFKNLQKKPHKITLIIRGKKVDEVFVKQVVVAAHSKEYAYVPQKEILKSLYDALTAEYRCEGKGYQWSVSQTRSYAYITLPEVAEEMSAVYGLPDPIEPGFYIATSDVGENSVCIRGFWRIKGRRPCICSGEEINRNHRGNFDVDEVVNVAKEKIFSNFATLPNRLCELLTIEIADAREALKWVFKKIQISKAIGKHNSVQMSEDLFREFDRSRRYTAYDIAMAVAEMPDRMRSAGYNQSMIVECERVARDAFFVDYKGLFAKTPHLTV